MGIYGKMRGWKLWGSAGIFRAGVGILLLGLSLAQSVPPQIVCPAAMAPQSLTQPDYQDSTEEDPGVGFIAAFVHSFLNTVQPNPFPKDLILTVVQDVNQVQSDKALINKILIYEVGFLVCIAIGVVYIVLMPIVGFFLACCRCCGNCGGKMYQKQTSSIHCCRRTLYWSTFVTTVIILAGNICMFRSNEALKVAADRSAVDINKTIDNLDTYLTTVPQQVLYVVNESYSTVQEVSKNLDAIGPQLGSQIQHRFRGTFNPALQSLLLMDQEIVNTSIQLKELNTTLAKLQSSIDILQANVTAVKNDTSQTISKPDCTGCTNLRPELQKMTLDTITFPGLSEFESALDEAMKADLKSRIKEIQNNFNNIPQTVTNDTKDVVQKSKQALNDIQNQISQVTDGKYLSALDDVTDTLDRVQRDIGKFTPYAERAEYIRWAVCLALCCVVLLVVVCNLLGLVLGPLGLTPKADPAKRSCTADCGGTFFVMGAGFSFLFSWLFMILVVLLFLLGGNIYTLLCQPWKSGELLKVIDTPGVLLEQNISTTLGVKNVSISGIYSDCEKNEPLWSALHLYELIDLENLLNISKYTEEIKQEFDNTDITLSTVTFLSPEVKNQLSNFSSTANNIDFTTLIQQMNNISSINLNITADKLDLAATQTSGSTQTELQNEANSLRQIQADIETTIIPQLEELNSTIEAIRSTAEKINRTVGEVLSNVGAAQDFFNTNTTQIVKTESRTFLDCQLGYFTAYADWANITITQEVGRCGPVAGAIDSAQIIICSNMVESLNAFWLCLGWCLIFFIPSIIFSIKLAKYYRRMKYSDVFDDRIIMNHIPRAQMTFS
ncbi:prominin-2 [Sphaeramia orbicularis]|uniref:Prominin-1-A-like n=1 Tax=Sphaeramia orbicularis TaxID=375764 RepID=A0A673BAU4_9TELE|nr:prominin-1-A-like [Sphaeramia orbicularis]